VPKCGANTYLREPSRCSLADYVGLRLISVENNELLLSLLVWALKWTGRRE
jgi:hypothetical protein